VTKLTNICPNCFLKWESDKFPLQCLQCNSNKIISHKELNNLNIAHLDCDSFYASVEKRDNQIIKNKPVVVGGSV
jgi:DNA polymerase-4